MARDIEEFLRKAAERRAKQKGGGQQNPTPQHRASQQPPRRQRPLEPIVVEEVEIVEVEPLPKKHRSLKNKLEGRENAERLRKADMREQSVSEHVKSHIGTSRLSEPSRKLGQRIASVHDQVEARVHQHLDHDISKVDDKPTITNQAPSEIYGARSAALPSQLKKMLSDPNQVGKAILLAEILKRPDFD